MAPEEERLIRKRAEQVHDLLWSKAAAVAARSGREPDTITAHDSREHDDGFVEHRALFSCKEIR